MWRTLAALLAAAVGALTLASAGAAATVTVQIKSTGFSPATITINHDDKVTWHNADKVDHQVVADDGSFASPILHAGPVLDEDALDRRARSAITTRSTRGAPARSRSRARRRPSRSPSRCRSSSTGRRSRSPARSRPAAANQSVELDQQPYGPGVAEPDRDRQDRRRRRVLLDVTPTSTRRTPRAGTTSRARASSPRSRRRCG